MEEVEYLTDEGPPTQDVRNELRRMLRLLQKLMEQGMRKEDNVSTVSQEMGSLTKCCG